MTSLRKSGPNSRTKGNSLTSPSLIFQLEAQVATITLNRPEAGNTFDSRMAYEFSDACDRVNQDDLIRVAVLRGAGDTFCLGDDSDSSPGVADVVSAVAKPVIACINGDAISAGLELALACDIRIASVNARFGLIQLQYGLMPHHGGTQRLPRLVGRGKALELILTGAIFDSAEAARMGLVSQVAPATEVANEASKLALRMAAMAPYSLRFAKEAINKGLDLTLEQGLRLEADLYFLMQTTRDRVEGITCYLQKKAPHFEGR